MAIHHKNHHHACHDLSYFVKIYRSKNKRISVNFCVIFIAQATYTYLALPVVLEDVIMKKCLTLLIATVLSGILSRLMPRNR